MLLDNTTRKLQIVLTAAKTTNDMPVCVYYVDTNTTDLPLSGIYPINSNGVTAVDILAAPAISTQRKVNAITVNNVDTAAKTVQIYLDDNGTDYLQCAATLQVGDVLGYTDTRGWYVNDSAGNLKVTPTNAISATLVTNNPAGNIAATNMQDVVAELDAEKMAIATYDADADGVVDRTELVVMLCRNTTGVTISKMAVVYISGASGQNPVIALAKADSEATSAKTIGVVTADITNNSTGYVALLGELHDFDTSAFSDGNTLWLSATVAGGMTTTRPSAPNHAVLIGFVAYSHANNGKIALNVTNGQELDELHDVLITTVANNEVLQYDSASATWKNRSTLAGLTFTAPVLGTPTSGDLRNCSLAVAPAIGGTTPSTGAFTTLSASGVVTQSLGNSLAASTVGITTTIGDTQTNVVVGHQVALGSSAIAHIGYKVTGSNAAAGANAFEASMQTGYTGDLFHGSVNGVDKFRVDYAGGLTAVAGTFTGNVILGDASTDTVTINGYAALGTTPDARQLFQIAGTATGGVTCHGLLCAPIFSASVTSGARGGYFAITTTAASYTLASGYGCYIANATKGAGSTITDLNGLYIADQTQGTNNYGITSAITSGANKFFINSTGTAASRHSGDFKIYGAGLLGYDTGSGGTVTQLTSRTTGVTINKSNGEITLVSAAGTASWQSFTVTNSLVTTTTRPVVIQKSGTDKNIIIVNNPLAGSFEITFATTGGTTTEQPVFRFELTSGATT